MNGSGLVNSEAIERRAFPRAKVRQSGADGSLWNALKKTRKTGTNRSSALK
jgi:hypothetical protein